MIGMRAGLYKLYRYSPLQYNLGRGMTVKVRAHLVVVAQSQQGQHIVRVKLQSLADCQLAWY